MALYLVEEPYLAILHTAHRFSISIANRNVALNLQKLEDQSIHLCTRIEIAIFCVSRDRRGKIHLQNVPLPTKKVHYGTIQICEKPLLLSLDNYSQNVPLHTRGVTNSWLRQNRISEYGEYGQKWVIFVFSKRKTAFFEHQIRFSE